MNDLEQAPESNAPRDTPSGVWSKVNFDRRGTTTEGAAQPATNQDARDRFKDQARQWRRRRPFMDFAGGFLWLYIFLQVFVFDVDDDVIAEYFPAGQWIVDYKFVVFVGVLAVLILPLRRKQVVGAIFYVLCFPLIVLLWKIPKLLYKTDSWVVFLSAANIVSTVLAHLKRSIVALAVGLLATLTIFTSNANALLLTAIFFVSALLLLLLFMAIRYALAPSKFLRTQGRAVERVVDSDILASMTRINDELQDSDVEEFNAVQQTQFLTNLSMGVLAHRLLYYWAYQLDRYRQSSAPLLFSTVTSLLLLIATIVCLTLINYGLYRIDSGDFLYGTAPSLFAFARYAFTSLYGNEIDGLHPGSDATDAVALASMFIGIGILGTFIIALFNSRPKREAAATAETIRRIKQHGSAFEERLEEDYEVNIKVAIERLRDLEAGFVGAITTISSRIPPDFDALDRPRPPS